MSQQQKTIGILTSGGDAPGMNAVIRAVVRTGLSYGFKVLGIRRGYAGLINGDIFEMNSRSVSEILYKGGTILRSARSMEFKTDEGISKAVTIAKAYNMDAVVIIGGDGSFKGAMELSKKGIGVIGIPGTIDNDIGCSEYTIGYDTAMNTALDALDKLKDTSSSHERCSVLEVMGREAGYIALNVGIAGGAEALALLEKPFDFEKTLIKPILDARNAGKSHFVVIVAEGIGGAAEIAKEIERVTGIQSRATILGHIQRGGSPTLYDRVMASRMGAKAAELINNDILNQIIAFKNNQVVGIEIEEALKTTKEIDEELIELCSMLSH